VFWLVSPSIKTTGILQASPSKNIVFNKEDLYSAIQEREFKPFIEVKCVRPLRIVEPPRLKCREQLEVWTANPSAHSKTEYRTSFSIETG